ncbi:uncharacterized protein LOC143281108 [Babylonia areolata]|uniref:uncharacterized protein LOC143281108 n=1 Tax=Babylonia areolata TaxID=304850 RepID=UPI003FD33D46
MEAAPYDNVEFGPITRKTGTWPGPQTQQQQQGLVTTTTQHTSRTLQHHGAKGGGGGGGMGMMGMGGGGVGVGANRLAPLEESQAEMPESRDQRMQAVTHHTSSSSSAFSSSTGATSAPTQQVHRTGGFSGTGASTVGSSSTTQQGPPGSSRGAATGLLTMSAPSTTTTSTATSSSAFKSGAANTATNNKTTTDNKAAATAAKTNAASSVPTYVLTQVGSGGAKDTGTGLRSGDDDVDFKRHDLDPSSRGALEEAYKNHGEFYRLNSKVLDEGALLKQDVLDIYRKAGESFSYEQLLQGMLEDGEMLLLGGCWLHYVHVEFRDEAGVQTLRQPYGKGRLCLTNNRVLLLAADVYTDANLEPYGKVQKNGGYKLEVSKRSCVVFRNLPVSCFYSADLEVNIGTSAQTKITSKRAFCCGLCACFGVGCCSQRWHSEPPMTRSFNERIVRMGVALPPWGQRTTLVLHLDPGQSLTMARDFVVQLHQHSPNMH